MYGVIHPRTGKTTHVDEKPDGLWQTPDGIVLKDSEIKTDSGDGGILVFGLLCLLGSFVYHVIQLLV